MLISPLTAIKEGWITGIKHDDQIQPNAIDFTVDKIFTFATEEYHYLRTEPGVLGNVTIPTVEVRIVEPNFSIREDASGSEIIAEKEMTKWSPLALDDQGMWQLSRGNCYDALSDVYLNLPEGIACLPVIQRSTFNRNGVTISSGLYDAGFCGHAGFLIHNQYRACQIGPGTRIGQIAFVESQSVGLYSGGYNHEEGTDAKQH